MYVIQSIFQTETSMILLNAFEVWSMFRKHNRTSVRMFM